MELTQIIERTQAIKIFWDREIDKIQKLKPSTLIAPVEVIDPQSQLDASKTGVQASQVNELWKTWTAGYTSLLTLATESTKDQSRDELLQIYGVTMPVKKNENQ